MEALSFGVQEHGAAQAGLHLFAVAHHSDNLARTVWAVSYDAKPDPATERRAEAGRGHITAGAPTPVGECVQHVRANGQGFRRIQRLDAAEAETPLAQRLGLA
jgi:hypothetical protein